MVKVDLATFPDLKTEAGPVSDRLRAGHASEDALTAWKDLVSQEIVAEDEDAGY